MKLLLIAPPSAHRNEVSAFLAQRGAEVEVRSAVDPSARPAPGGVDAIVVLDGDGRRGVEPGPWPPDVPVIRSVPPPSASGLQELAFRVAQAAHGTVTADASWGGARASYRRRAGSVAPGSATPAPLRSAS